MDSATFQTAATIFDKKVQDHMLMCVIHDAFAGDKQEHYNCLGDNFNDLTRTISKFLQLVAQNPGTMSYDESFSILSHILNSTWERISDIFEILGVPESYQFRHYAGFKRIRLWANFFKHPKEFAWLVCMPIYCLDKSSEAVNYQADASYKTIDEAFLKKYYSADRAKGLAGEFVNYRDKTVVILPDVVEIIAKIADELNDFVGVVTENPVYYEVINDKSTIMNFFDKPPATTTIITTTTTTTTPRPDQNV